MTKYNVDFSVDEAKRSIRKVYPEFRSIIIGESASREYLVFEIEFPDGTYYFCVTDISVSSAYSDKDTALNQ